MGEKHSNRADFKSKQSEQWSNVAAGWRRRWPSYEQGAQALSDRLLDLAHVTVGQRVLDVATGIGEPAMTAARRVGPSGKVVAIDQAPQMLAVARERMQEADIHTVEFMLGDAEAVTLPAESFHAVVCRWGLALFQDPVGALARFRSSLVPGGWLAVAVWGPPERVPLISLPFSVFSRELTEPVPLPKGPNPFALSVPAPLEQALRDAGLAEVKSESFPVTFEFASMDDLLGHLGDVSAPVRMITSTLSPERRDEFWEQLATAAGPYLDAEGRLHLANDCLVASGQRPARHLSSR